MNIKKELINILTDWYWDNMTKTNKIIRLLAENNLISCKKCKLNVSCFSDICDKCENYDMFEYEEDKPKCKGYAYTEKGKFEITEVEGDEVYYRDENGVERAFHEGQTIIL